MALRIFFSYSHDDEEQRNQLEKHLALLKRQGLIEAWHDRRIVAEIEAGARCPDDVALACGAGARCGGCRPTILALLASLGRVEQPVAVSA